MSKLNNIKQKSNRNTKRNQKEIDTKIKTWHKLCYDSNHIIEVIILIEKNLISYKIILNSIKNSTKKNKEK